MSSPQRVVQRLRLRAPTEGLVRRGATLLEDALRTATAPLGGRVLCVRTFSVGTIRADSSAAAVSTAVEERLRDVATHAVHADASGARIAPAVYFRHESEPLLLLAVRLAGGASADEWFWPIVVRQWHRGMSRGESLRVIAYVASADRAAPAPLASIVAELTLRGTVDALLTALMHSDAAPLLKGCSSADLARALAPSAGFRRTPLRTEHHSELSPVARQALDRWIGQWGATDPRTAWLAAMLLVGERRSLAGASDLPMRVRNVVTSSLPQTTSTRGPASRAAAATLARPGGIADDGDAAGAFAAGVTEAERSKSMSLSRTKRPASRVEASEAANAATSPRADPQDDALRTGTGESEHTTDTNDRVAGYASLEDDGPPSPTAARESESVTTRDASTINVHGDVPVPDRGDVESGPPRSRTRSPRTAERRGATKSPAGVAPAQTGPRYPETDVLSAHAGLLLLIPAMTRLGMGSCLEAQPALLTCDFATRVLRDLARQLAIPPTDGVWQALDLADDEFPPRDWSGDFVVPEVWRELVVAPRGWVIRPEGDAYVLTDGSSRLVLARWHGRANVEVKTFTRDADVRHDSAPAVRRAPIDQLLCAWRAAIRRYCHRAAGVGLRAIVARRGRIAAGRTHLDVVFDSRTVDIRIRRAGLDSDPNWVPWLGRVVQFHYESEM